MAANRKSDQRRACRCAVALRKRAYHFLRNAAAIFSIIHRSPTQISHNAIRNPMTSSRRPMSFQKDLPPPGIYDGACAIVKRNPSPCIWKALRLISAEERRQQTCNLRNSDRFRIYNSRIPTVPSSITLFLICRAHPRSQRKLFFMNGVGLNMHKRYAARRFDCAIVHLRVSLPGVRFYSGCRGRLVFERLHLPFACRSFDQQAAPVFLSGL
jgi:hypothetical protein